MCSDAVQRECVWRQFIDANQSFINTWTYGIESAFHERLLQASIIAADTSSQLIVPASSDLAIDRLWTCTAYVCKSERDLGESLSEEEGEYHEMGP